MDDKLRKILFVDDDELVSELAVMVMEREGLEVLYCDSGLSALEQVTAFAPQLILLDVLMPEMDGIDTFEALRKMPESASIPIVFLTGLADGTNEQKYTGTGALGLIAKPFEPDMLCKEIEAIWQVHR